MSIRIADSLFIVYLVLSIFAFVIANSPNALAAAFINITIMAPCVFGLWMTYTDPTYR
jgi:hypothetical protein